MLRFKQSKLENKEIFSRLRKQVEVYRAELDAYSNTVVLEVLKRMSKEASYKIKGTLAKDDKIGYLLLNAPAAEELSLPKFLGQHKKDGTRYEIIKLKYGGYLYISVKDNSWQAQVHINKPEENNPYLDIRRSFRQTLPMIVRDAASVSDKGTSILRFLTFFK